jgi:tRNA pseudouridine55 synthase
MNGALIIDKPAGMTSHDVISRVRRAARTRRVGHAGTLDPFATGVLVVCLGRATRLMQFLVKLDKEYLATVRLGFATDTQDVTGKQITPFASSNELGLEDVRRVLDEFEGPQSQTPPMYSAKKIGGERLYRAARAGRVVEREPVAITVHSIDLVTEDGAAFGINDDGARDFRVRVRCSSGTYIRTLAHDIGARLGVGAHLAALRRTAVGHFTLSRAVTLDEVERGGGEGHLKVLVSPSDVLAHLPKVVLDEERKRLVMNGRAISLLSEEAAGLKGAPPDVRLCDESGKLVAVGEYDRDQGIRPRVVLEPANEEL